MNGIDWRTIGNPTFERVVKTLLSIEFGPRGCPIEGRGGEGDIPATPMLVRTQLLKGPVGTAAPLRLRRAPEQLLDAGQ
jgi:hypothetical protein